MERILIQNGLICDGTGEALYQGSLIIEDGFIRHIVKGSDMIPQCHVDRIIDGVGKIVTPGFIDIHRHCDVKPFYGTEFGDAMLIQGITTTVVGNCGISMTPCPQDEKGARQMYAFYEAVLGPVSTGMVKSYTDYIKELNNRKLPVNMAAMIGTGAVRISIKGFSDKPYTEEEIIQATLLVEEAMKNGAPGVSMGIMYLPECYSSREEFARILKPVGHYGGVVTAHIRGEGDSLLESVKEVIEIGAMAGCALEISHFKSCGMANWGTKIHEAIAVIEEARKRGQDVTCDFYPYEGGSTALTTMLPPAFVSENMEEALKRLGTKDGIEEFRQTVAKNWPNWDNYAISLGWDRILISGVTCQEHKKFLGKNIEEAAHLYGYEDAPALAAYLMHAEEGRTAIINLSMCQEDIDTVAKLPYSLVISDSIYADTDTPHPRMYGSFPKVLREYVRERKILTLEEAVHKMTWLPAKRMKILKRGQLMEGWAADLNIFDLEAFNDHATFHEPSKQSTGLSYCILNGKVVVENGEICNRECGTVLQRADNIL